METRHLIESAPSATGRRITGYALLFNTKSQTLGGREPFVEIILPGSLPPLETQDVRALLNHEQSRVLARSKHGEGTLELAVDSRGLRYSFIAPKSGAGDDLLEAIRRGDIDQSSFSFTVSPGGDRWSKEDGVRVRRISKIERLIDVSPVTFPAYAETTVAARKRGGIDPEVLDWRARLGLR